MNMQTAQALSSAALGSQAAKYGNAFNPEEETVDAIEAVTDTSMDGKTEIEMEEDINDDDDFLEYWDEEDKVYH